MRKAIILVLLLSACTRAATIAEAPVHRSLTFSASQAVVAQCAKTALRARMLTEPAKQRIVVYNNPTTRYDEGITHYAMVFRPRDKGGIVEFRKLPAGPLAKAMMTRFWNPVERCAKQSG